MVEKITNGNFEDGETGWTFGSPSSSISDAQSNSPTHSVFSYSDGTGFYQVIDNVAVDGVTALTFYGLCPAGTGTMWIIVTYTDDSYTEKEYTHNAGWTQRDIVSFLTAGKIIKEIRFKTSTDAPTYIDDVSLTTDATETTSTYSIDVNIVKGNMKLTNASHSLEFERVLDFKFGQKVLVAKRPVSNRTEGEVVDTGTITIFPIEVVFRTRLTDTERATLQTIFDDHLDLTLTCYTDNTFAHFWTFSGGIFKEKEILYENIHDESGIERSWFTRLILQFEAVTYE